MRMFVCVDVGCVYVYDVCDVGVYVYDMCVMCACMDVYICICALCMVYVWMWCVCVYVICICVYVCVICMYICTCMFVWMCDVWMCVQCLCVAVYMCICVWCMCKCMWCVCVWCVCVHVCVMYVWQVNRYRFWLQGALAQVCIGGIGRIWVLADTLSYTATWREKPRLSLRPCFWATCWQISRDVEAESTEMVRLLPVARMTWIGMCFLDLTA